MELYRHNSVSRSKCKRAVRFVFLTAVYDLGLDFNNGGGGVKDMIMGQIQNKEQTNTKSFILTQSYLYTM
jgi:hypothetical protein